MWIAYLVMIPVIFLLPYFSLPEYNMVEHTTSQLAAQQTPRAWIMNAVFLLLGLASIVEAWTLLRSFWLHQILLTIFGWSLIMTAIFQHAPIPEHLPFDANEDYLHSIFAKMTGWSFTIFAISAAFIERSKYQRISALAVGVLAIVLSILMFAVPQFAGVWQRGIFLICFGWLVFFLDRRRKNILANSDA